MLRIFTNLKMTMITASTAIMMIPVSGIFCAPTINPVSVPEYEGDTKTVIEDVLQIVMWVVRAVGVLIVAKAFTDYLTAKQDENSVGESRAVRLFVAGLVLILAPSVLNFLLNGHT